MGWTLLVGILAFIAGTWCGYRTRDEEALDEQCEREQTDRLDVSTLTYITDQVQWSAKTFGPAKSTTDVPRLVTHITLELQEILKHPHDCEEWVDVIILALEGAWRTGHSPLTIVNILKYKQSKNFARKWVIPNDPSTPIEHDRTYDERESQP